MLISDKMLNRGSDDENAKIFISLIAVLMSVIIISGPALAALYISSNATKIPSGVKNKDALTSIASQQKRQQLMLPSKISPLIHLI